MPIGAAVPVGKNPSAFALAGDLKRLYIATAYTRSDGTPLAHAVVTLDTDKVGAPGVVKASVDVSGTDALGPVLVSPAGLSGRFLYLAQGNGILGFATSTLDADGAPASAFTISGLTGPTALAASPDGKWLYVAEGGANSVAVVDVSRIAGTPPSVKGRVTVAAQPVNLAVSPDGKWLYVASRSGMSAIHRQTLEDRIGSSGDTKEAMVTLSLADSGGSHARSPADLAVSSNGLWVYVAADQGGHLLALDARQLASTALLATPARTADRAKAVVSEVAILPGPTGVALAALGGKLFAVSPGSLDPPSTSAGGVVVVDVKEEPCDAIFDRALEACPACQGDECIVLAHITGYQKDRAITQGMISNDTPARRFLYSTEILTDVIKCMLDHGGTGAMGPAGQSVTAVHVTFVDRGDRQYPAGDAQYDASKGVLDLWIPKGPGITNIVTHFVGRGQDHFPDGQATYSADTGLLELWIPKGEKGDKGDVGLGLDPTLTHIRGFNWTQGNMTGQDYMKMLKRDKGFVVAFDAAVKSETLNDHTFLVSLRMMEDLKTPWPLKSQKPWLDLFIAGTVTPVQVSIDDATCRVTKVGGNVPGVLFQPVEELRDDNLLLRARSLRIVLKGDFILDRVDRPIDPEHMHRLLPNGLPQPGLGPMQAGKPCASGDWVPGGDFESWIDII
jgi:DNA-binding beta-propeller fold protein YncE